MYLLFGVWEVEVYDKLGWGDNQFPEKSSRDIFPGSRIRLIKKKRGQDPSKNQGSRSGNIALVISGGKNRT